MSAHGYIWVPNWPDFQNASRPNAQFIKLHVNLLGNDAWLDLSPADRCLLVTIWMLAGRYGNGRVKADQRWLQVQANLPLSNRYRGLERLNHAGFIEVRDASCARAPSLETETETETETEKTPTSVGVAAPIESLAIVKAEPRERNEQWDGLAAVFGYSAAGDEARLWGKLCRSLKAKGATTTSIVDAARRYRQSMPDVEMTPTALEKHYQRLLAAPDTTKARPGTAEHTLMLARQAAAMERISA